MAIPTVDLSPFFTDGDHNEDGKKKETVEMIKKASSEYGFFQIENHGVPQDLMSRAIQLSKTFFAFPAEEKLNYSPGSAAPLPAGYSKQPHNSPDKNEYLLMFEPQSGFNILPSDPPDFRDVLEEMFIYLRKTGQLVEKIVNDCLGLPLDFLKEYNRDRSCDFMVALRYFPATETENNGISEHEDGNCVTFVIQDEVGGLEVKKDGNWVPVVPAQGTIVVNLGDVIQVLSNNKFKSATHRVVRSKEKSRHSFAFFYNLEGDKWVEPLPRFTREIGEAAKYRGFVYKDYQAMRLRNKTHPPSRPQDAITISHYAISTSI
ncbi:flavonol synthase/flavanone 3-hydroxylase [Phtheirospermum japonicum]|uniref:Flavonol synthase/flavanone 3-hydroxylase n=1 Tax=Phtheirospermum japonicum TaxID=374723 RepID=A0A830CJ98_9LAMI|nr:flavonol synthase/flavanone 3-hydroxylase [Phtheirospermum japonicum]